MNRAWPRPGSDGVARCGAHFPRASATALLSYAPAASLLEKPAGLVHRAVVAHLGGTHVRVGRQVGALAIFHVGKPRRLSRLRRLDACMDRRGWLPAAIVAELLKRDARDFDVNVDPVEQRAGEALLVAADHHRAARAGMFGIAPIITRARILGSTSMKFAGKVRLPWARLIVTILSSKGCRSTSYTWSQMARK